MHLGKALGWLIKNSATPSKSPGYDNLIHRMLRSDRGDEAPHADNTIDAEDDVSTAIIACALFTLGFLSLFNLFGNSLIYPYGTFFPHWSEFARFAVFGIIVGATMIGLSALAILMAGRAPAFSLALSIAVAVVTSQLFAALGQLEVPQGVNGFNGAPGITIAGIMFAWYYFGDDARRLIVLVCGVMILIGVFVTGSYGVLEYLANGLIGLATTKFDLGWLLYFLVCLGVWCAAVLIAGGTAHGFATVASPQISPFKTSALFLSILNLLVWVLWIAVLAAVLTKKRSKV